MNPSNKKSLRAYFIFLPGQLRLIGLLFIIFGLNSIVASPNVAQAQEQNPITPQSPAPFDPEETQHGFSKFETLPSNPTEALPAPLPYYKKENDPDHQKQPLLDQKPEGLFLDITLAEDFDEDLEFHRGNLYYPVRPTEEFSINAPAIYVVFRVFKHYAAYQVIGQMFPDTVADWPTEEILDEDMVYLTLEDESGYLKFFPPPESGWKAGHYHIDIYVGYEANAVTKMGTMRFRVTQNS